MQKFTLLALGDTFEYQGERYTKSGPMTASRLDNGSQRMIPRSAVVSRLSGVSSPTEEVKGKQLPAELVLVAFEHYHTGCMEWLQLTEKVDASLAAKIRDAMDLARQRFLAELQQL